MTATKCKNCGAKVQGNTKCLACGTTLGKKAPKGTVRTGPDRPDDDEGAGCLALFGVGVVILVALVGIGEIGTALGFWGEAEDQADVEPDGQDEPNVADGPALLRASEYGERWPLTVDEVYMRCHASVGPFGPDLAVTAEIGGEEYAVNGEARNDRYGLEPIDRFRAEEGEGDFERYVGDLNVLIQAGLSLC